MTVSIICDAINHFRSKTWRMKASIMALSHSRLFALAPHQRPNILVRVRHRQLRRGGGHILDIPTPSTVMLFI